MHDLLRGFGVGFISAALFLPTALLAGGLAYLIWTMDDRGYIGWPIAGFAFSTICIACFVRSRNPFLRVACLLGTVGASALLLFFIALFGAS